MGNLHIREFRAIYKQKGLTPKVISLFQGHIWQYYRKHGRSFSWRETADPYHILVSEIMLQQTQTSRVESKYNAFLSAFPGFLILARTSLREVLQVWQGLGYNRRALALHQIAQQVVIQFDGQLPSDPEVLRRLPGIGPYTAGAVAAIAFNKPTPFIDTNIRSVFFHFFFDKSDYVSDRDILTLVERTLDKENPREWYYALYDYGAMIKHKKGIPRTTKKKPSAFQGSNRQLRGQVLQLLLNHDSITEQAVIASLGHDRENICHALAQLQEEGFIEINSQLIHIK